MCTLAAADSESNATIVAPNNLLQPPSSAKNTLDTKLSKTDVDSIISTARIVDQKAGATGDAPPGQAPPPTTVTAVDGKLMQDFVPLSPTRRSLFPRLLDGYDVVFQGTGMGPTDRDASIEGTAYLTYTVVPNNTYSVDDCLRFCDRVTGCGKSVISLVLLLVDLSSFRQSSQICTMSIIMSCLTGYSTRNPISSARSTPISIPPRKRPILVVNN